MKIEFLEADDKVIINGVEYVRVKEDERPIDVNGYEVTEPIYTEPEIGQTYYVADISAHDMFLELRWNSDEFDKRALARGIAHLSKGNAIIHSVALLSFTDRL